MECYFFFLEGVRGGRAGAVSALATGAPRDRPVTYYFQRQYLPACDSSVLILLLHSFRCRQMVMGMGKGVSKRGWCGQGWRYR